MCPVLKLCKSCKHEIDDIQVVTCSICTSNFHPEHCSVKSLNSWRRLGKRRLTWKCAECRNNKATLIVEECAFCPDKDEIIKILKSDLYAAMEEVRSLKLKNFNLNREVTLLRETSAKSEAGKSAEMTYASVTTTPIPTKNRFEVLSEPELSEEEPAAHRSEVRTTPSPRDTTSTVKSVPKASKPPKKRRVWLFADSHGRDCASMLQEELGPKYEVFTSSRPGAPFNVVADNAATEASQLKKEDCMIVMAGTNNFNSGSERNFDLTRLKEVANNTKVIVTHVPLRYDLPSLNNEIGKYNVNLDREVKNSDIECVSLSKIARCHYTSHGLHFKRSGKRLFCKIFAEKVNKLFSNNTSFLVK